MRLEAWLDGRPLSGGDPRVVLTEIREEGPRMRAETLPALRGAGRRVTRLSRESLSVTLLAELHEDCPEERQALLDRLCAWAGGRMLSLSTRPGRVLDCVCSRLPGISAMEWTEPVSLTLTAWTVPWWQSAEADTLALEGLTAGGTLHLRGTEETVLEAEVTAREDVDTVSIACGEERMLLSGLGLSAGDRLLIGHDANAFLTLRAESDGETRSVLHCREAESGDEISLKPGCCALSLCADGEVSALLSARGRWR